MLETQLSRTAVSGSVPRCTLLRRPPRSCIALTKAPAAARSTARLILARLAARNTHAGGLRCRPAPRTGPHRPVRLPPPRRRSPQGLGMRAAAALAGLRAATPCPAAAPAPSLPLKLPQLPQPAHSRPARHHGLRSRRPIASRGAAAASAPAGLRADGPTTRTRRSRRSAPLAARAREQRSWTGWGTGRWVLGWLGVEIKKTK